VFERGDLGPGAVFTGPAIVEQVDTTTVVHPGQPVTVDGFGNLIISVGG
jgi:N-methylhydantoinase A